MNDGPGTTPGVPPLPARCGDAIGDALPAGGPLTMTADLPDRAAVGGGRLAVTVTVTNRGDTTVAGTTSAQPDMVMARDGRIVAVPLPRRDVGLAVHLGPGAGRAFDAVVSLERCTAGGGTTGPLPAGGYQVFAIQRFDVRGVGGSGTSTVYVHGGPWPIVLD